MACVFQSVILENIVFCAGSLIEGHTVSEIIPACDIVVQIDRKSVAFICLESFYNALYNAFLLAIIGKHVDLVQRHTGQKMLFFRDRRHQKLCRMDIEYFSKVFQCCDIDGDGSALVF